jgi:hypothetical protein
VAGSNWGSWAILPSIVQSIRAIGKRFEARFWPMACPLRSAWLRRQVWTSSQRRGLSNRLRPFVAGVGQGSSSGSAVLSSPQQSSAVLSSPQLVALETLRASLPATSPSRSGQCRHRLPVLNHAARRCQTRPADVQLLGMSLAANGLKFISFVAHTGGFYVWTGIYATHSSAGVLLHWDG